MANEKILNTRIQLKYDSLENWSKVDKQFKLLPGEIAVAYLAETKDGKTVTPDDGTHPILFKVGSNNEKTFNELPWASALAADVYAWAKKARGESTDIDYSKTIKEINENGEVISSSTSIVSIQDVIDELFAIIEEDKIDIATLNEGLSYLAKNAYILPEGGIEEDLSESVKASLRLANSALQEHQNISHLAIASEVASTYATKVELDTEMEAREYQDEQVLQSAKNYADQIKNDLLGNSETLTGTYDTLKEIHGWITTHDGETVVNLTQAISDEASARQAADEDFEQRIGTLEEAAPSFAFKEDVKEVTDNLTERIDSIEETIPNLAEKSAVETDIATALDTAKEYADGKIEQLHTIATTGKISDLSQDVNTYVIFNCGSSTINV